MIDRGGSGAGGGAGGLSGTAMPDGDGGEAESKGAEAPRTDRLLLVVIVFVLLRGVIIL